MAQKTPADSAATDTASDAAVAPTAFPLSLEEFCARLSATDSRVELIGAFFHTESVAGRRKDTEANYQARFNDLLSRPA